MNLKEWTDTWQLRFNVEKCKTMHLGKTNQSHDRVIEANDVQVTLTVTEFQTDLGVNFDKDLKFINHTEIVSTKVNRLFGMIRRSFSFMDGEMLNTLF